MPDKFWVVGDGDKPEEGKLYYVRNVDDTSAVKIASVPMNWFQTKKVEKIINTNFGMLFATGDALWQWEQVVNDHGSWIRD